MKHSVKEIYENLKRAISRNDRAEIVYWERQRDLLYTKVVGSKPKFPYRG